MNNKVRETEKLFFEYAREFGPKRTQSLLFVSEDLHVDDVMRDELAAEYLKNPEKKHLAKHLRRQLEEDLGL